MGVIHVPVQLAWLLGARPPLVELNVYEESNWLLIYHCVVCLSLRKYLFTLQHIHTNRGVQVWLARNGSHLCFWRSQVDRGASAALLHWLSKAWHVDQLTKQHGASCPESVSIKPSTPYAIVRTPKYQHVLIRTRSLGARQR